MQQKQRYLITGGTGKTGRRIVERLAAQNYLYRVGSRSGEPAFDWYDETTWQAALKDVTGVYIAFQPDLAAPGSEKIIDAFIKSAKAAGVERLVLLSGRGEKEAEAAEQLVIGSGLDYGILRASWFHQNFSENFLLEPIKYGDVQMPSAYIPEPFIDADDIADGAVKLLTATTPVRKLYEITGPELITFEQATNIISAELGRDIQFTSITIETYAAQLRTYELPQDYIELITYLFTDVMDGRNSSVTNGLEDLLGRKPGTFRSYVKKTAATGVWDAL